MSLSLQIFSDVQFAMNPTEYIFNLRYYSSSLLIWVFFLIFHVST